MDNKKEQQETTYAKLGIGVLVGTFVMGYIVGAAKTSDKVSDAYNKGCIDAFNSILSKIK